MRGLTQAQQQREICGNADAAARAFGRLAIVAGIAAEHGGTARAANVPPADGGGARFTLTLPRRGPLSPAAPQHRARDRAPGEDQYP
jgi:hypothetical protein